MCWRIPGACDAKPRSIFGTRMGSRCDCTPPTNTITCVSFSIVSFGAGLAPRASASPAPARPAAAVVHPTLLFFFLSLLSFHSGCVCGPQLYGDSRSIVERRATAIAGAAPSRRVSPAPSLPAHVSLSARAKSRDERSEGRSVSACPQQQHQ